MNMHGAVRRVEHAPPAEVIDLAAERERRRSGRCGRCEPIDADRLRGPKRWCLSVPFDAEVMAEARAYHPEAPPPAHQPVAEPQDPPEDR